MGFTYSGICFHIQPCYAFLQIQEKKQEKVKANKVLKV